MLNEKIRQKISQNPNKTLKNVFMETQQDVVLSTQNTELEGEFSFTYDQVRTSADRMRSLCRPKLPKR